MSNEHCLVFARATGLFPDPAQQFFFALPFLRPFVTAALPSPSRPHKCCLFSLLYHRCGPQSPFRFRRAATHY